MKLVIREAETVAAKRRMAAAEKVFSSEISQVEVVRAIRRRRGDRTARDAEAVLAEVELVALDQQARHAAAQLMPTSLRSLDAIHIATALGLNLPEVVFVGYDKRLQGAAEAAGLKIESPGA